MRVPDWAEEDAEVDGVEVDHAPLVLTARYLELVRRRSPWVALAVTGAFFPMTNGALRVTGTPPQDWLSALVNALVVGCLIGVVLVARWGRDERVTVYRVLNTEDRVRIDEALDSRIQP